MDYRDRHVVVTGGTGALGTAVVGALLEAGAVCHVPYRSESEAKRFPHADNKKVSLVTLRDLADEAADRKSTRLNSSHGYISYAVFCLKKKKKKTINTSRSNI